MEYPDCILLAFSGSVNPTPRPSSILICQQRPESRSSSFSTKITENHALGCWLGAGSCSSGECEPETVVREVEPSGAEQGTISSPLLMLDPQPQEVHVPGPL